MNRTLLFCQFLAVTLIGATPARAAFRIEVDSPVVTTNGARDTLPLPLPPPPGTRAHLYRMNYWYSGSFIAAAAVGNVIAIPRLIKNKPAISDAEIAALNPLVVPAFDRWALRQNIGSTERPDKISDYILNGAILGSGLALGLDRAIRKDALRIAVLYVETQAITFSLYNFSFFGPFFQNKYRPVVYYESVPIGARRDGNNRNSFYSGHVASAAAATFAAAKIYSDYHPELGGKRFLLYGAAAVPPLAVAYLRVRALKHFPSDNLVGLLIGGATGLIVPELHRFKKQAIKVSAVSTPVGPGLCFTWKPGDVRRTAYESN